MIEVIIDEIIEVCSCLDKIRTYIANRVDYAIILQVERIRSDQLLRTIFTRDRIREVAEDEI